MADTPSPEAVLEAAFDAWVKAVEYAEVLAPLLGLKVSVVLRALFVASRTRPGQDFAGLATLPVGPGTH